MPSPDLDADDVRRRFYALMHQIKAIYIDDGCDGGEIHAALATAIAVNLLVGSPSNTDDLIDQLPEFVRIALQNPPPAPPVEPNLRRAH